MGTEQNKKIALGLLENLSKGNIDGVLNAMAESATWWTAGSIPPISGTKSLLRSLVGGIAPAVTQLPVRVVP